MAESGSPVGKQTGRKGSEVKLRLLAEQGGTERLHDLGRRIASDTDFRLAFMDDPTSTLLEVGIDVGEVKLSPRDHALLELVGDDVVSSFYHDEKFIELQKYIAERYRDLNVPIDPGATEESVVADFDVVIEVEAVAVALVAAAAIVIGAVERPGDVVFERVNQMEQLFQARIASLEARLATVESRVR